MPDFARQQITPFAISYDAVEVLGNFAANHGITYPLLADEGSQVIRALGLFNEAVYEHHDAYGIPKHDRFWGVPYPGVFLLDAQGKVMQKRFQQSYRERETAVGILEQGFGARSSIHGAEVREQAAAVQVHAYLDSATYRFFQRLWLTVTLTIAPGRHVYGQPIPEGYVPLTIDVAPQEGLMIGAPQWPTPQPWRIAGLAEAFVVYEGQVTVTLPVTFTQEGDDETLRVTVRYQTCSETDCDLPSTVELSLPVHSADHVERPRRR